MIILIDNLSMDDLVGDILGGAGKMIGEVVVDGVVDAVKAPSSRKKRNVWSSKSKETRKKSSDTLFIIGITLIVTILITTFVALIWLTVF